MTDDTVPPTDPHTSEATQPQLDRGKAQGDAYGAALEYMVGEVADTGGMQRAGDYIVAYAIEEAEGMYEIQDGKPIWRNPVKANSHVEIAVRDAADGRFVPYLTITTNLITPDGEDLGSREMAFMWHPMIHHYGFDWEVPADGKYTLKVHIDAPVFLRHDEVNGRRFLEPVDVVFESVAIERAKEPVAPPHQH